METEIIKSLIQIFGIGGVLMMAVKYLAQKLSEQYERRIDALEDASKRWSAGMGEYATRTDHLPRQPSRG
jgi:hypothetical protein